MTFRTYSLLHDPASVHSEEMFLEKYSTWPTAGSFSCLTLLSAKL